LSVTRPFDSSPALYYKRSSPPCVYLAPLRRYGASNVGCTDTDTERKKEEGKEKKEGGGEGKGKWKGKKKR